MCQTCARHQRKNREDDSQGPQFSFTQKWGSDKGNMILLIKTLNSLNKAQKIDKTRVVFPVTMYLMMWRSLWSWFAGVWRNRLAEA